MAKCFYCHHCGGCGPSSYTAYRNPAGLCPFCAHQNGPEATTCAQCGKPLPRPAGLTGREGAGAGAEPGPGAGAGAGAEQG